MGEKLAQLWERLSARATLLVIDTWGVVLFPSAAGEFFYAGSCMCVCKNGNVLDLLTKVRKESSPFEKYSCSQSATEPFDSNTLLQHGLLFILIWLPWLIDFYWGLPSSNWIHSQPWELSTKWASVHFFLIFKPCCLKQWFRTRCYLISFFLLPCLQSILCKVQFHLNCHQSASTEKWRQGCFCTLSLSLLKSILSLHLDK